MIHISTYSSNHMLLKLFHSEEEEDLREINTCSELLIIFSPSDPDKIRSISHCNTTARPN